MNFHARRSEPRFTEIAVEFEKCQKGFTLEEYRGIQKMITQKRYFSNL